MAVPMATLGNGKTVHLGRKRPKNVVRLDRFLVVEQEDGRVIQVPQLKAHHDKARATKAPAITTDWLAKMTAVVAETYGNTEQGDCVIASILKRLGGWVANVTGTPALSTDQEALRTYVTICGPGDQGCVITDVLDYAKTKGIPIQGTPHKIDGYVGLDLTNWELVQVAVEVFGPGACIGINLPGSWADAVQGNGFVWDLANDASVGGHDVPIVDVTEKGVEIATWGYHGTITKAALANTNLCEESYVGLGPDWENNQGLAPNGIDKVTLAADLALVGQGKVPPIGPTPPPPPQGNQLVLATTLAAGTYPLGASGLSPDDVTQLQYAQAAIAAVLGGQPSNKQLFGLLETMQTVPGLDQGTRSKLKAIQGKVGSGATPNVLACLIAFVMAMLTGGGNIAAAIAAFASCMMGG